MITILLLALTPAHAIGKPRLGAMAGYYRLAAPCSGAEWDVNYPDRDPVRDPLVPAARPHGRERIDPTLPELRLVDGATGPELRFRAPNGGIAAIAFAPSDRRDLSAGHGRLSVRDHHREGSGIISWKESAKFDARLDGDRLETRWRVSESAYQMEQTCVFERVLPAPAPVMPGPDVAYRCRAELREAVPYSTRVTIGEEVPREIFSEVYNPSASGPAAGTAASWFNGRWEQNGQSPYLGDITVTARSAPVWQGDFELEAGAHATVESPNALTPGATFAVEIESTRIMLATAGGATTAPVRSDATTAQATAQLALGSFRKTVEVEGHALRTPDLRLSATLSVACRKPGARP